MADQINMGGLSLNEGGQQGGPQQGGRSYIPPHMRRQGGGPPAGPPPAGPTPTGPAGPTPGGPPVMNDGPAANGIGNSAWAK
jgi:ATP-dependent RNA helicase DDX3X